MNLETIDIFELYQLLELAQDQSEAAFADFRACIKTQNKTGMDKSAKNMEDYLGVLNDVQNEIERRRQHV